ncbi:centrosomal protein POC5 [Tachyglossus aculeatus]|uniref:centrosomal protein POC5 n=1 Tax=Tachyglossus aculeatus TaxID=9261 RepID=UPI0018F61710|nr:centrosomal protein POC5 [Tachyglossus aculeatus]
MSSDEKSTTPVLPKDSDRGSSVSSDLQDEYEELLRYAVVTPNFEPSALRQSHHTAEVTTDGRCSSLMDDVLHHQPSGRSHPVKEHRLETLQIERNTPGRAVDFVTSSTTTRRIEVSTPVTPPPGPSQPIMEFFSSHRLNDSPSPVSSSSHREVREAVVNELPLSDENFHQIENILDLWSGSLKTNILTELTKWKLNIINLHNLEMRRERDKHAAHVRQLCSEIENLKELLQTYETSLGRKDEVISNLTQAIDKQKERIELMKKFTHWRIQHVEARQEAYANKLADQQFHKTLMKKVWKAWHSTIVKHWKDKVERACQERAEEVCVQISNDYEAKIAMLNDTLEGTKAEIQRMQCEREQFEESMKKAFMRGVCALNLEAMTMFQNRGDQEHITKKDEPGPSGSGRETSVRFDFSASAPLPSKTPTVTSEEMLGPRVVTSVQQKAGKTVTARITGRSDFNPKTSRISSSLAVMGVSPPMSSVIVEKHHPVTQQTISQATAAKYPRIGHHGAGTTHLRPTSSGRAQSQSLSAVQSIKVVE